MAKPDNKDKREARQEEEKADEKLLVVIDGAILECKLCTVPIGMLKVNFDTPTIQGKKTATVMEKDSSSLIFMGTCIKSPNSAVPCAAVMSLGQWKDTGTFLVQDQKPLLKQSTIMCNYGGSEITITDTGQINIPDAIDVKGAPIPEPEKQQVNGHFYNEDGSFEGKVDLKTNTGLVADVYTCTGKSKGTDKNGKEIDIYNGLVLLKENGKNITNSEFSYIAYVVMHESGEDFKELKCVAYASYNRAVSTSVKWNKILSTGYSSVPNKKELPTSAKDSRSKLSRKAVIYVLKGEDDLTKGAEFWDGTDFLAWGNSETNPYNKLGQNKFDEYKFIEIPKDIYDAFLLANGTVTHYGDKSNHNSASDKGAHEHVMKKTDKKILDKAGKPVLDKNGKPTFHEVAKIKYPLPAADFEEKKYWTSGSFYYETGVAVANGISGTVNAGKSIFWKLTKTRLTSETTSK